MAGQAVDDGTDSLVLSVALLSIALGWDDHGLLLRGGSVGDEQGHHGVVTLLAEVDLTSVLALGAGHAEARRGAVLPLVVLREVVLLANHALVVVDVGAADEVAESGFAILDLSASAGSQARDEESIQQADLNIVHTPEKGAFEVGGGSRRGGGNGRTTSEELVHADLDLTTILHDGVEEAEAQRAAVASLLVLQVEFSADHLTSLILVVGAEAVDHGALAVFQLGAVDTHLPGGAATGDAANAAVITTPTETGLEVASHFGRGE